MHPCARASPSLAWPFCQDQGMEAGTAMQAPQCLRSAQAGQGRPYLTFTLGLGEMHLLEDLRPLLHHQRLLIGVGRDVTLVLWKRLGVRKGSCQWAGTGSADLQWALLSHRMTSWLALFLGEEPLGSIAGIPFLLSAPGSIAFNLYPLPSHPQHTRTSQRQE